jgi:hypothetical protein
MKSEDFMYSVSSEQTTQMPPLKGWMKRLLSAHKRRADRIESPSLAAYFWDGGVPKAHVIRDISESGMYLVTTERWYPRTLIMMTIQDADWRPGTDARESITVQTVVVRADDDGVGLAFVPPDDPSSRTGRGVLANGADRATLLEFIRQHRTNQAN